MNTICVMTRKGGAGKSTLTLCLSVEAARKGLKTVVLDTDPQSTISKWSRRRKNTEPQVLDVKAENVAETVLELKGADVDLCLIDTIGKTDGSVIKCAKASDLLLIPTRPYAPDIEALEDAIDIAQLSKKPALAVINAINPNSPARFDETRSFIEEQFGITVFPYPISQRAVFADSWTDGTSPQENEDSVLEDRAKATREIKLLYHYLAEHLDLEPLPA